MTSFVCWCCRTCCDDALYLYTVRAVQGLTRAWGCSCELTRSGKTLNQTEVQEDRWSPLWWTDCQSPRLRPDLIASLQSWVVKVSANFISNFIGRKVKMSLFQFLKWENCEKCMYIYIYIYIYITFHYIYTLHTHFRLVHLKGRDFSSLSLLNVVRNLE